MSQGSSRSSPGPARPRRHPGGRTHRGDRGHRPAGGGGCMLGRWTRARAVAPEGRKPARRLILTQGIAIEGTAVLAREREAARPCGAGACHRRPWPAPATSCSHPGDQRRPAARLLCEAAPPPAGVRACTTRRRGAWPQGCGKWRRRPGRGDGAGGGGDGAPRDAGGVRRPGARSLRPPRFRRPAAGRRPGGDAAGLDALADAGIPARVVGRLTPAPAGAGAWARRGRAPWPGSTATTGALPGDRARVTPATA